MAAPPVAVATSAAPANTRPRDVSPFGGVAGDVPPMDRPPVPPFSNELGRVSTFEEHSTFFFDHFFRRTEPPANRYARVFTLLFVQFNLLNAG